MPEVDARSKEPVAITFFENGAAVTGATLRYDVSRITTGGVFQLLNFTTMAFVAPPLADEHRYRALAQVDATAAPGLYADATGGIALTAITNRTIPSYTNKLSYTVTCYQTAPTARTIGEGEIVAGVTDTIRRRQTNKRWMDASGKESFYADDGSTVEVEVTYTDVAGSAITIEPGNPARATAESTP